MSSISVTHPTISDEQAIRFFQELKQQLHYSSLRKIVTLVRSVFSNLRGTYTEEQKNEIMACTPHVLKLVLESTSPDTNQKLYHLDELVDVMYQEDRKRPKSLFRSEIETLKAVSFVLRKAEKLYNTVKVPLLNQSLTAELHEVAEEEMAF